MILQPNIRIVATGEKHGTIEIYQGSELAYKAEGVNGKRATHWDFLGDYTGGNQSVQDALNSITECTNYAGVSEEKLNKYDMQ